MIVIILFKYFDKCHALDFAKKYSTRLEAEKMSIVKNKMDHSVSNRSVVHFILTILTKK